MKNRLRLKTSIDTFSWLILQVCAFRGHDEIRGSKNQCNFCQLIEIVAYYNDVVAKIVLDISPFSAKNTPH